MTDHWKDVKPWCDAGRFGWIASWDAVDDARAKDAEAHKLELAEQRLIGHGEGQEHTIADVNAGRIDDLIAPRLAAKDAEIAALKQYIARLEAELETEDV